jgi:threonine/homoserine/homoserine lactone efflux protein
MAGSVGLLELIPHPLVIPVGFVLGILIAAPVGPVSIICIQRAIERGTAAGILAGLGAVLGDGLIALLAALGVGQITGTVSRYRDAIQLVGGLVLIAFGLKLMISAPRLAPSQPGTPRRQMWRHGLWDVPQTFLLTVTNPGAVLGLVAIFGGISSFVEVSSTRDALWLALFIVVGSLFWWIFLAAMVGRIRHRVTEDRLRRINVAAGVLLVAFGAILTAEIALKALRAA